MVGWLWTLFCYIYQCDHKLSLALSSSLPKQIHFWAEFEKVRTPKALHHHPRLPTLPSLKLVIFTLFSYVRIESSILEALFHFIWFLFILSIIVFFIIFMLFFINDAFCSIVFFYINSFQVYFLFFILFRKFSYDIMRLLFLITFTFTLSLRLLLLSLINTWCRALRSESINVVDH